MANKRIPDLEESNALDLNDLVMLHNSEPNPPSGIFTYKKKLNDVLALKTVSVNGVSGNTIVINADNISDTATTKKFTTAAEKSKVALIKTDQGTSMYLSGNGTYQPVPVFPTGYTTTTIMVVTNDTTLSQTNNHLIVTDTSSNPININLPLGPVSNQSIKVKDAGNAFTNVVIVDGSGKQIEASTYAEINSDYGAIELVYVQSVDKWLVLSFVI